MYKQLVTTDSTSLIWLLEYNFVLRYKKSHDLYKRKYLQEASTVIWKDFGEWLAESVCFFLA